MFNDAVWRAWQCASPSLSGSPEEDAQALAHHVHAGERLLDALPAPSERRGDSLHHAQRVHKACRALRQQFLARHANWLYDRLTHGRNQYLTLSELVYAAAGCCPGLVPTQAQIDAERTHIQAHKEGREIDQGLLFQALLRLPEAGRHLLEAARRPSRRALELIERFRRDGTLDLGTVSLERRDSAAHLTINNAHCLNAEDDVLTDDMETAVDLTLLDDEVRVGVLRGGLMTHPRYAGRRVFSAGINLKTLHLGQISFVDFLLRREFGFINKLIRGVLLEDRVHAVCGPLRTVEKPWLAAVDGFAIGGGAQLLLVFDRVIAAADSYVSLPAATEGIVPGFANLRLSRLLGSRMARQLILGGRKLWAHEPDARQLLDEVVDPADMETQIARSVAQLSASAIVPNRHMLNLAEEPLEHMRLYAAEFALIQAERLYDADVLARIHRP
jgi:(3,5-dihydroxyphenyl)acetyl-CoA 1,2-dioxygenase